MIVAYTELPNGAAPRPLVDIDVAGIVVKGLVDSGAVNTIFHSWVADSAAIDLSGAPVRRLGVGGAAIEARFQMVERRAAGLTWEAEVGFSEEWVPGWALLGHSAFFRFFRVMFRAADLEFEVDPEEL